MTSPRGAVGVREAHLIEEHTATFAQRFGPGGRLRRFFAPGRVNLMGAHLDYNGGPVMPAAVDRGTFLALRERADGRIRMASTLDPAGLEFDFDPVAQHKTGHWVDYPLGVLNQLLGLESAAQRVGLDMLFGGNLSVGAGLSSSASICFVTAMALSAFWQLDLTDEQLVQVALRAEREFVGVQCGIMDPYAVGMARPGHLLWLDCRDVQHEHLPLDGDRYVIGVADTGVRRELARGAFNERVAQCSTAFERLRVHAPDASCLRDIPLAVFEEHGAELEPTIARRARHVLLEVARTFEAKEALLAGRPEGLGLGMTAAHFSLRDDYEVSCPELDVLVESAVSVDGVLGSRLTGAGFGGCIVVLLQKDAQERLRSKLGEDFSHHFGRRPAVEFYSPGGGPCEV